MSISGAWAAGAAAAKVGKQAAKAYKAGNRVARKLLAEEELARGRDLDKNGRVGSIGRVKRKKQ